MRALVCFTSLWPFMLAAVAPAFAQAPAFPAKTVRILVGFAPGGATDLTARIIAQKLTETWGQSVLVENRPGASGMIGADAVAKAPPDGYTLIMATQTSHTVAPSLYGKIAYDPIRDFAPVTLAASASLLLVLHPSVPAQSVKELIALARAHPGALNFGSGGNGSSPHLAGEVLKLMTGVKMVHVPYKGEAPALADVLGGQLSLMFSNLPTGLPYAKSGRLRALAVTSRNRSAAAPEYPTMIESGLDGYDVITWFGLLAPGATPRELVVRLHGDTVKALNLPDVRERIAGLGLDLVANTPEQFAAYLKADTAKWAKVVKDSGMKAE